MSLDSSCLLVARGRSRVGRHHFLNSNPDFTEPLALQQTFINAPIYVEASILCNIIGAASESDIEGGYVNARIAVELHVILIEMGYLQPKTPLELDNVSAFSMLT